MPSYPIMTEKRLPRQSDKWSSFILNELRSWGQLPPGTVPDFQYVDSEKADQGYALASVVLDVGDNIINIPVVIRDWKLCPMDIMEVDGALYPLTARRLNSLAAFASPFTDKTYPPGAVRDQGQNITGAVVPPVRQGGMTKTMAEAPHDDLITAKLMASSNPDVSPFLQALDQNAYAQYKNHGIYDILYGIISHQGTEHPVKVEGGKVEAVNPGEANVLWVPRPSTEDANRGNGTVIGASGRAFDPFMMHLPVKDLMAMYSNMDGVDPLKKVQVFVSKDAPDGTPVVDTDWSGSPGHDIGVREIKPAELAPDRSLLLLGVEKAHNGGNLHMIQPGAVIECLYHPDDLKKEHTAALTSDGSLFLGDKFYGVYAKTADGPVAAGGYCSFDHDVSTFGGFDGSDGRDVIFVNSASDGDVTAIGPLRISHREVGPFDALGEKHISVTFHGRYGHLPVQIMRSDLFKDYASQSGPGGIKIFLPATFNCVGISGVVHSPKSPEDVNFMAKTAHLASADWVRGWSVDNGSTVSVNMPDVVKVAYQQALDEGATGIKLARMAPEQAEFVLIAGGMAQADAARFVKTAQREAITAFGMKYLPAKLAQRAPETTPKEAELKRDLVDRIKLAMFREVPDLVLDLTPRPVMFKRAAELTKARPQMTKEAAAETDRKTVDAVLGLGLADEHNIDVLIDAKPKYEEVLENLTWALKESRVTGGPIRETLAQKAMMGVENYLEEVEAFSAAAQQLRSSQKGTNMAVAAP